MGKSLFIAEKPSVAQEFAKALKENMSNRDGYKESDNIIVTWCVGHLVTMSYPDAYDEKYAKWRFDTLPFLPKEYKYEIIKSAAKQFHIVAGLLNRPDVDTIYVCTDSGREGEYIYRLVEQEAHVEGKQRKRVWIDSQTEEEILRGIREAKDESEYDNISASAYLRAKEDYLMGINFSRALSLKYGRSLGACLNEQYSAIAVGRVMTCVLGMVVRREREIRQFIETPFYRVIGNANISSAQIDMEWKAVEGSKYFESPLLYKENGFKKREDAETLISELGSKGIIRSINKKSEKKAAPQLFNLAEIQGLCSKMFKITPDQTLQVIQELYEKKLVTYPRTDARVLSTAVCKEITKNINGLKNLPYVKDYAEEILNNGMFKGIEKTKYCNDSQITDHYAIIPTGQGFGALSGLSKLSADVYEVIVKRFLAIFYPPAIYETISLDVAVNNEHFFASDKYLKSEGYLKVMEYTFKKKKNDDDSKEDNDTEGEENNNPAIGSIVSSIKKGDEVIFSGYEIKEGKTSPPKRYTSGSIILAMENAGKLIEDEELRAQIKGSGIGTSATRAEIVKKLTENNNYLAINKKTQVITPTIKGELIFDIVGASIPALLNAELTASWEKGLTQVAEGSITSDIYMEKLESFVANKTERVKSINNAEQLRGVYQKIKEYY